MRKVVFSKISCLYVKKVMANTIFTVFDVMFSLTVEERLPTLKH